MARDDVVQVTEPPRFESIVGVAVSPAGGRVTVAVMTTDTHQCWGTRTVHLAHFSVDELRRACADALRF